MRNGETPTHARIGVSVATPPRPVGCLRRCRDPRSTAGPPRPRPAWRPATSSPRSTTTLVTDSDALIATVRSYRPGDEVDVTFQRDGEEQTTAVTLESDADTAS